MDEEELFASEEELDDDMEEDDLADFADDELEEEGEM